MRETFRGLSLDRFQQEALEGIARDEDVVVAAPTGSGKTLIAHYAIERALAEGKRAVYTAPIKALSNQKYRDLCEAYPGKVGISTGDVSIDAHAPVVVMTTEIFRNTIFDAPERTAEIGWVIFDEVHYLDDPDRGTVWEESLIFAPACVRVLALSATVSNLQEFADWLSEVRDHTVRVVLETKRPVPLEVYVASTEGKVRTLERLDELRLSERGMRARLKRRSRDLRGYYEQAQLDLVHEISECDELPLLFFLFSRNGCERLAAAVAGRQDLHPTAAAGRAARAELERLADAFSLDLNDPDLKKLVGMVERGVAYHHAGVLPGLKEVVERLFGAGHIRLLCATETFALGVNMPARSVAFEGVMRWNGKARVPLMTRQYAQMAGRAGRRGLDPVGSVYLTYDPFRDDPRTVRGIVNGIVEPVRSQFDLSYGTLLNLYKRLGDELFTACERSFANYRANRKGGAAGSVRQRESSESPKVSSELRDDEREGKRGRGRGRGRNGRGGSGRNARAGGKQRRGRRERREGREGPETPGKRDQRQRRDRYLSVVEQVKRKIEVLTELGYIDRHGEVSRQGRFAMQVFGHELELSEIVFSRALEGLSPEQIAVVAAAIVFESRSKVYYGGREPQRCVGKQAFRLAGKAIHGLIRLEEARGIKQTSKPLDWNLSGAVWAWVHGADFSELREMSDASDGDVVRSLRQTIQVLRLGQAPLRSHGDDDLAAKFAAAQRLLKRDLVDAEVQLRRAGEFERLGLDPDALEAEPSSEGGDEEDPNEISDDHLAALPSQPLGVAVQSESSGEEAPEEDAPEEEAPEDDEDSFSYGLL